MRRNVGTYLRSLTSLAMSLGVVQAAPAAHVAPADSAAPAAPAVQTAPSATDSSSGDAVRRMEAMAAAADAEGSTDKDLAAFWPWYYQAWPESTFRQLYIPGLAPTGPNDAGTAELLVDILDSVS